MKVRFDTARQLRIVAWSIQIKKIIVKEIFSMETTITNTATPKAEPVTTVNAAEELCGSENILDTIHLKNLVDDLSKLYSTSVCTKVARDTKAAAEKRLIEAIRANLDRYN